MNLMFADLLKRHLNETFKTPESAAAEWGIQADTVRGLLTGRLLPASKHAAFFSRRFAVPERRVAQAIAGIMDAQPSRGFDDPLAQFCEAVRRRRMAK